MANVKIAYGGATTATAVTITLTSLASGAARESVLVDNSTNLYADYMVKLKTNSSGAGTATVDVYVADANQGTTPNFTDGATGTDVAFTAANIINARYLGSVTLNGTTIVTGPIWSLNSIYGGSVPVKFNFIVKANQALSATAGDHALTIQGVFYTSV